MKWWRATWSAGRLSFTTDLETALRKNEVVFIAVGTPPADDGSADLSYVEAAAREVARTMDGYKVIVDKSTVPVGTARKVRGWMAEELGGAGRGSSSTWYPTPSSCAKARPCRTSRIPTAW